jgi:hypothetical protein
MKILIANDAGAIYRNSKLDMSTYELKDFSMLQYQLLRALEGQEVEVSTHYVFDEWYNVLPLSGDLREKVQLALSNNGMDNESIRIVDYLMRIHSTHVADVIDDIRPGRLLCMSCCKNIDKESRICGKCQHGRALRPFKSRLFSIKSMNEFNSLPKEQQIALLKEENSFAR